VASTTAADECGEAATVTSVGETSSRSAINKDESSSFSFLTAVPYDIETGTDWTDCHYDCGRLGVLLWIKGYATASCLAAVA